MTEYVLRVAGKRQVTLPEGLLKAMDLQGGDEFGIQFVTPTDIRLVPYSRVQKALITPEIEEALRKSEEAFNSPQARLISLDDLEKRVRARERIARRPQLRAGGKPRDVVIAGAPAKASRVRVSKAIVSRTKTRS